MSGGGGMGVRRGEGVKEEVDHMRTRLGLRPLIELQDEDEKLRPE